MAITEERVATATVPQDTIERPASRRSLREPVDARWAIATIAAWLVGYPIGVAVEPVPAQPDAAEPLLVVLLATVGFVVPMILGLAGLAVRRRWGFVASAIAATGLLALTLACPVSGHHEFGAWWGAQLAIAGTLVLLSASGLRRA